MTEDISTKSKKNEIFDAYQEALKELKTIKQNTKQELKILEEGKALVSKTVGYSTDEIVKNIATLKLSLTRALEEIETQLLVSHKQLVSYQQAIDIQTQQLADLHDIKVNADTLSALLLAHQQKTTTFEREMKERVAAFEQEIADKHATWKREYIEFERIRKEEQANLQRLRQREEEEYLYQRNLTRQKEQDTYLEEKASLDKELATRRVALEQEFSARETTLTTQEQELKTLRIKVENHPKELEKAVLDATKSLTERLTSKFNYDTQLTATKVEGEHQLLKQMIATLEAKVAQLEAQTKQATEKTNQAHVQVQDIALKALESASLQRFIPYNEKTTEQTVKQ